MPTRRTPHVLLVEDDPDHADLITRELRRASPACSFHHATDGASALAYLRRQPPHENAARPDFVLLDLKLPRMDGHEVLEDIRGDPGLDGVPVVILTTSQNAADCARAYTLRANSYLVKPFDCGELGAMIDDTRRFWTVWNRRPDPPPGPQPPATASSSS
jgi:CheY-like chemotaxis protein